LRVVLDGYDKTYITVDDPGVLMDVDTPEDYQKAIDYYNTPLGRFSWFNQVKK
jgi:molybdenum cofactor cytidylyltransferase